VRGLQIESTAAASFNSAIRLNSGNLDGFTLEYCRVRSTAQNTIGMNSSNATLGAKCTFRNNVFVHTVSGSTVVDMKQASGTSSGDVDFFHNTIYAGGGAGVCFAIQNFNGATVSAKNNIAANSTNPFDLTAGVGGSIVTDYNWTDAGTDGTTNEQDLPASWATTQSTAQGANFSLLSALATGAQVGSITDDITGATRDNPPDAGAYELVSATAGAIVARADYSMIHLLIR
jgi:hypothetical protein